MLNVARTAIVLILLLTLALLTGCADSGLTEEEVREIAKQYSGVPGPKGDPGPQGETGLQGPEGPRGLQGETGPQGIQGKAGPQGERGERGAQGEKGEKGDAGPRGDTGLAGPPGPKGDTGARGPQGEPGEDAVIPTATPVEPVLTDVESASLWVEISQDASFSNFLAVYSISAFDIEAFALSVIVNGILYCNTEKMLSDDEFATELGCAFESGEHDEVQDVSAYVFEEGAMRCVRHVASTEQVSAYACEWR